MFGYNGNPSYGAPENAIMQGLGMLGGPAGGIAAGVMGKYGVPATGIDHNRNPYGSPGGMGGGIQVGGEFASAGPGTPDNVDGGGGRPGTQFREVPWTPIGNTGFGYTKVMWGHDIGDTPMNYVPKPSNAIKNTGVIKKTVQKAIKKYGAKPVKEMRKPLVAQPSQPAPAPQISTPQAPAVQAPTIQAPQGGLIAPATNIAQGVTSAFQTPTQEIPQIPQNALAGYGNVQRGSSYNAIQSPYQTVV